MINLTRTPAHSRVHLLRQNTWFKDRKLRREHSLEGSKLALVGNIPDHVFSFDPAVSSPTFIGEKRESGTQKVPTSGGKIKVYEC